MYRTCLQNNSLVWDTETNAMFHPDGVSPEAIQYREWLKEGGVLFEGLTQKEKVAKVKEDLERQLAFVDSTVFEARRAATFELNGRNFYLDLVTIPGMYMALPLLPPDFRMTWKTADKEPNGIDNIEIQVTSENIKEMYLAQMTALITIWTEGELAKKRLKQETRDILLRE